MKKYRVHTRLTRDYYDTVYADNAVEAAKRIREQYADEGVVYIISNHEIR